MPAFLSHSRLASSRLASTFVAVGEVKRWGQVVNCSNSGKTVMVNVEGKLERHSVDEVKIWHPPKSRVFINGDAMPKEPTLTWLEQLCQTHQDVLVWKTIRANLSHTASRLASDLEARSGLPSSNVHVVPAQTQCSNAADALLTALYGRHARPDAVNYVLSNDKAWFSEVPHIFKDVPTKWLTFTKLNAPVDVAWLPRTWLPGRYKIVHDTSVTKSLGRKKNSPDIATLRVGFVVEVLEVEEVGNRIRGRIQAPGGWISLTTIEGKKKCWALPVSADLAQ